MRGTHEKILIRGVNWLGDAVMTTPALLRLREAKPNAHIALLTHEKLAGLWENHPVINEVITFSTRESAWKVGQKLIPKKFDIGLALPNSHRSALELHLSRIPRRIGYARPFRSLFLTESIQPRDGAVKMRKRSVSEITRLVATQAQNSTHYPANAHHIFQYLHLVATLGATPELVAPQLGVAESATAEFQNRIEQISGRKNASWLGLNPGAEYGPAKRWPADRFVAAAVELHKKIGCGWIVFGANDAMTQQIASTLGQQLGGDFVVNLAGKTTLRELCAGLKYCRIVLTNDTGPMHVTAALGTPVVVPFGSTSPELTGPGLPGTTDHALLKTAVPCAPCFLRECPIDFRCMKTIEIQQVVEAALRVFNKL